MKVLYLTKYTRKGASSRLRSYQYFPYLKTNGVDITVSPLFDDMYLQTIYTGRTSKKQVIKAYWNRLLKLFGVAKYDKIVIEYELFPYLPAWIEWIFTKVGVSYIVDYDDAIFHNYDLNNNWWVRRLLSDKIDRVMRYSSKVVVGNSYLGTRAERAGAKSIEVIPTVVDLNRYKLKTKEEFNSEIIIGWIGTKSTFKYVEQLKTVFQDLSQIYDIKVHVVGVDNDLGIPDIVKAIRWTEDSEVEEIRKFDIGIMPLSDTPWEQGKCSYKLIQYMACGLPVVASPVGMNNQVVREGENGLFAQSKSDWVSAFEKYIADAEMRKQHGQVGRGIIEEKYCLERAQLQWLEIFRT